MPTKWRSGSISVSRNDCLERIAARAKGRVPSAAQDEVRAHVDEIVGEARSRWPVKTGRSRAGLDVVLVRRTGAAPRNRVSYAGAVHRSGSRLTAWDQLIRRPLFASRPELHRRLRRRIVAALRGER